MLSHIRLIDSDKLRYRRSEWT